MTGERRLSDAETVGNIAAWAEDRLRPEGSLEEQAADVIADLIADLRAERAERLHLEAVWLDRHIEDVEQLDRMRAETTRLRALVRDLTGFGLRFGSNSIEAYQARALYDAAMAALAESEG